jgi:hypothetical protein
MPLLDHFNPPLSRTHPWRSFHGAWAAAQARLLNQGILPSGYYAVPLVDRDGPIGIDVASLRDREAPEPEGGGVEPRTWAAPAPAVAVAVDLATVDGVEIQVFSDDGDPRLTAAVELFSPRNKDRLAARQASSVKCVGYLQQGSSVVVVDTVATRRADLNISILSLLGVELGAALPLAGLSAVSYRAVGLKDDSQQLQVWSAPLALGQPLATLPLWIASDSSVPLDLEASYQMTCADLRIHQTPFGSSRLLNRMSDQQAYPEVDHVQRRPAVISKPAVAFLAGGLVAVGGLGWMAWRKRGREAA